MTEHRLEQIWPSDIGGEGDYCWHCQCGTQGVEQGPDLALQAWKNHDTFGELMRPALALSNTYRCQDFTQGEFQQTAGSGRAWLAFTEYVVKHGYQVPK